MLAILALAGIAGFALLYYALPQYYFGLYPAVPVFFIVLGLLASVWSAYARSWRPGKLTAAYLGMRGIKLMLTIIAVLLYFGLVREQMPAFAVTVFVFYEIAFIVDVMLLKRSAKNANKITA